METATPTEVTNEAPTAPIAPQTNVELVFSKHGEAYGAYVRETWAAGAKPVCFEAWLTANTSDRLPRTPDLTDFTTIESGPLRGALEWRGHSVYEQDGLWFSCCKEGVCHESRAEAELCCAGGLALELADEVQP